MPETRRKTHDEPRQARALPGYPAASKLAASERKENRQNVEAIVRAIVRSRVLFIGFTFRPFGRVDMIMLT